MQRSSGRAGFGDVEVERVCSPRRLAGLRRRRGARGGEGDPERQDQQTRTAARGARSTGATWCFGDIYASIACPARPRGASRRPAPARRPRRATRTWDERGNMRTATRRPEREKTRTLLAIMSVAAHEMGGAAAPRQSAPRPRPSDPAPSPPATGSAASADRPPHPTPTPGQPKSEPEVQL